MIAYLSWVPLETALAGPRIYKGINGRTVVFLVNSYDHLLTASNGMGIILRIIGNAVALYVAFRLVPGFVVAGGITDFLLVGLVLGLLNFFVKPILKLISTPLIILTLGLFLIVVNAIILWLIDALFTAVTIQSLGSLFWATIIIALVNFMFTAIIRGIRHDVKA